MFLTGTRCQDIHRRINPFVRKFTIQLKLHVTCTLEFFKDNFVHFRSSIDQSSSYNGQGTPVFQITGSTKETFWFVQGIGIHTTRKYFSGRGRHRIVCTGQT
ncbi:MAG: hypothetical protein K2Q22_11435, partial [Cytophagales bacterium]|nr:hypothetical protein [Cytophagales bacterium]